MNGPKSDVEFKIGDAHSAIELGSAWQELTIDQTKRLEALVNKLLPVVQEELAYRTGYQHEDQHVAWSLVNGLLAVPELLAFVTGKPDASTNDEGKPTRGCSSRWAYERYLMAYADDLVGGSTRHRDENERVVELAAKAVASCDQHSGYVRSYKSFMKEVERLFDTTDDASRYPTCGPAITKDCERCGDKVAHAFTDQGKVGADGLRCVTPESTPFDDPKVERAARLAHEANRLRCMLIGDDSQKPWDEAPGWQKDSARMGAQKALAGAGPIELHESWMNDKLAAGWVYGAVKDAEKKTHPCLVPYVQLPLEQRVKDYVFRAAVNVSRLDPASGRDFYDGLLRELLGVASLDAIFPAHAPSPDQTGSPKIQ